jgi:MoxR-like ATPase
MKHVETDALADCAVRLDALRHAIGRAMVGQAAVVEQVVTALLASGHVLIEGVPGLGKTLLVRALAQALSLAHSRVQFTPDLMPSDITGHAVLDPATRELRLVRGPVFTQLLLADEINRAPAKTQSALLEVMQEQQVTLEGHTYKLTKPFMVLATQNPVETEGTYPLPESQLDRFLFKIEIGYPSREEEVAVVARGTANQAGDELPLFGRHSLPGFRRAVEPAADRRAPARRRAGARLCGAHRAGHARASRPGRRQWLARRARARTGRPGGRAAG